jgi:hypothetical protein
MLLRMLGGAAIGLDMEFDSRMEQLADEARYQEPQECDPADYELYDDSPPDYDPPDDDR